MTAIAHHKDLLSLEKRPLGSPQPEMLPFRWLTSDNDQSSDVECTGAEPSNQPLGTPHTVDLQTCYICQGTSDQESIMTCGLLSDCAPPLLFHSKVSKSLFAADRRHHTRACLHDASTVMSTGFCRS